MACRFCDNIQKSYPNKRLRVLLFFRYPISVCRFSLGYWQRNLFTHQPPVVPQSQPGKQCWKWLVWVRPSKSLWEGSTAPNSPLHTSSIQSFSFYYTEIYKWQGAEIWGCCYRLFITSYFHWFFRHICMNIIKTDTEMQKGFTLCI